VSVPAREADAYIRDGVIEAHTRFRACITDAPATVDTAPLVEEVRRVTAKIEDVRAAYAADAIDLADMSALNAKLRRDRTPHRRALTPRRSRTPGRVQRKPWPPSGTARISPSVAPCCGTSTCAS